ncbi:MAG: ATP-binding protein [Fibrobacterota bacterium]
MDEGLYSLYVNEMRKREFSDKIRGIISDTAGLMVIEADTENRIINISDAACQKLGISKNATTGKKIWELNDLKNISENKPASLTAKISDGIKECFVKWSLIKTGSGPPDGRIILIGKDISEKRTLQKQLLHSQKMENIGLLTGGITHDFKNLLSVISGQAEFARRKFDLPERAINSLNEIEKAAVKAHNLVKKLLSFSRKTQPELKIIDINRLIFGVDKMMRRLIGEKIEFVTLTGNPAPFARIDPGQLEQAVINLAVNARDAMKNGGILTIRAACIYKRNHCEKSIIEVSDTGTGIPYSLRDKIFEPFFSTKSENAGTGLGLSIVRDIVKTHGGELELDCPESGGSVFRIILPYQKGEEEKAVENPEQPEKFSGTGQILLTEDNDMVRDFTAGLLRDSGYDIIEAATAEEALSIMKEEKTKPRMLITDIIMPGMSGTRLAVKMREIIPDLKIIFISGYTGSELLTYRNCMENSEFLEKPFKPSELLSLVKKNMPAAETLPQL